VELDLRQFAKRVPVEILGGSAFPPVGQDNYALALPPYGFFWFQLATEARLPTWYTPPSEPLPEYYTLVLRHDIEEALQPSSRSLLEREVLPAYLAKRRWFASKTERLETVRLAYAARLPGASDVLIAEIEAQLPGRVERYVLPLAIAWEDRGAGGLAQQLALARVRRGRRVGVLTDGFAVDGLATAVLEQLRTEGRIDLPDGVLRFVPTSRIRALELPDAPEIRRLSAEQSNSSLIVADSVVLKIVRRVPAGIHPEGEMTRYLTERGFANTAALLGEVVRVSLDGTPHTLAIAQSFVRNQGDGWGWTLDYLARTVEELAVTGEQSVTEGDAFSGYAVFAANTGRRLAELHEVLSQPTDDPAFAPFEADAATLDAWADGAAEQLAMAIGLLRQRQDWPDRNTEELAARVIGEAGGLRDAIRRLARQGRGALSTRVHGDFHLGQILVAQGDAYIIDFEGEPARPVEQRRAKSCALRDVAGLLRSFDYAAASAAPSSTPIATCCVGRSAPGCRRPPRRRCLTCS
jgi:maltose alpha-D-glucosyltransferase/alpha-amylase